MIDFLIMKIGFKGWIKRESLFTALGLFIAFLLIILSFINLLSCTSLSPHLLLIICHEEMSFLFQVLIFK